MSYSSAEGRRQVLDDLSRAVRILDEAVELLGEAYEALDEQTGARLEAGLFRPLQAAFGLAKRTHSEFGARYGIAPAPIERAPQPLPTDPGDAIRRASEQIRAADETIGELQDSMLPVEVGDQELRAGLSHVRELIAPLPARASALVRTLGR
jgi:hypothetical protein